MRRFTLRFAMGETAGIAFGPEGPPDLVFLHATGFNALTYRALLAPLGQDFRVVALDQRGHGRSRLPSDPRRIDGWRIYVRDLLALLPVLTRGGPPPVLAGHSMGGAVALTATAARPTIAASLVLLDPVLPRIEFIRQMQAIRPHLTRAPLLPIAQGALRRRSTFPDKAAVLAAYRGRGAFASWRDAFLVDYVEDGFVASPEGVRLACAPLWEGSTFTSLQHYAAALLARLRCPVTILKAAIRPAVMESDGRLYRFKPDLALEVVPGSTHFLPMEQPELVRARLRAALERRAGRNPEMQAAPLVLAAAGA